MTYEQILEKKRIAGISGGFDIRESAANQKLFFSSALSYAGRSQPGSMQFLQIVVWVKPSCNWNGHIVFTNKPKSLFWYSLLWR